MWHGLTCLVALSGDRQVQCAHLLRLRQGGLRARGQLPLQPRPALHHPGGQEGGLRDWQHLLRFCQVSPCVSLGGMPCLVCVRGWLLHVTGIPACSWDTAAPVLQASRVLPSAATSCQGAPACCLEGCTCLVCFQGADTCLHPAKRAPACSWEASANSLGLLFAGPLEGRSQSACECFAFSSDRQHPGSVDSCQDRAHCTMVCRAAAACLP